MAQNVSKTTTDHDTIRRWVEERGGGPAELEPTAAGGGSGSLRIAFPGSSGEGTLRRVEWDEWFRRFDDAGLAFVYEEEIAGDERPFVGVLVARELGGADAAGAPAPRPAAPRSGGRTRRAARKAAARGGARKAAARGGPRRPASRGGARRKAAAATRRKARTGGRRVAARRAAARSTGARSTGARRSGSRRGTSRRGGGRSPRRSR